MTYLFNRASSALLALFKFSIFGLAFFPSVSLAALSPVEKEKVITITAQELTDLSDPIDSYALLAVKGGGTEPIPFQFDEMTKDGFVYIDGADSLALTLEGVKSHLKGEEGVFDEDDQLLFMFRDAGVKKTKKTRSTGEEYVAEISVTGSDGQARYVYLVKNARILSDTSYVRYSSEIGRAETDFYSLKVDQKNALVWDEFYFDSFQGVHPRQPFDTMKLGMSGHVLPAGAIPVYLTNKSIKAKALAEKVGPIRATTTFRITLKFLGLPWFVNKLQIEHFEKAVRYQFIMRMPELRRQAMANLRVTMSMDGRNLDGADVAFSPKADQLAKVDGEVSELEQAMNGQELSLDEQNWIWLNTHDGFSTFMTYDVGNNTRIKRDFNQPRVRMRYSDSGDKKQRHEFHEGQLPDAGFEIRMPQFGRVTMGVTYNMFDAEMTQSVEEIAKQVYEKPAVNIEPMK